MKDLSFDNLHSLLEQQLKLEIDDFSSIENGHNSRVYRLQTTIGNLVLRLQSPETNRFHIERSAIDALRTGSESTLPEILDVGELHIDASPLNYSLAKLIPGITLDTFIADSSYTDDKKIMAIHNLGSELHIFHNVPNTGYGLLNNQMVGTHESIKDWQDAIHLRLDNAMSFSEISNDILDVDAIKNIDFSGDKSEQTVFIHGDLVPRNVLVNPDTAAIMGIIDLEQVKSHVAELDLAYWMFYWKGKDATNALFNGYPEEINQDLIRKLAITRGIDAVAYWLEMDNVNASKEAAQRVMELTIDK